MQLIAQPLSAKAFSPYGELIDIRGSKAITINEGYTQRFDNLCTVDMANGQTPLVNIFRSQPVNLPFRVRSLERHPLGSQAFIPMQTCSFLVLVAPAQISRPQAKDLKLFISQNGQGVNFKRNVWHHFSLALEKESDFVVIDYGGTADNLEEHYFSSSEDILLTLAP